MKKPLFLQFNYLYVTGLIVLVTGLPLSLFLMSISQFILAGAFFLEGNVAEKFRRFAGNRAALLITGIWLVHLIGLLWTTDLLQGWNDLRIKLPLLVLTVVVAGSAPLSRKQFQLVLAFFVGAVLAGSMVSMAILTGFIPRTVIDIRDVFIFKISHIRFGLFTCIAIFTLFYFIFSKREQINPTFKVLLAVLALWLLTFLFIVELITGLAIIFTILILLLVYYAWKNQTRTGKAIFISAAALLPVAVFLYVREIHQEYFSPRLISIDINAKTASGNPYTFNFDNPEMENGFPVYVYMCEEELRRSWNSRSEISYDSLDKKRQPVKYTLIRFLASKGLRKDSAAMAQLTGSEIESVERGIPNVYYQSPSIKVRLMQVMWEFDQYSRGGDPTGHSIMQRLESWKAARGVFRSNLLYGVGTGDLPEEVHRQYARMDSKLGQTHYLRSHNQYLAIACAFGIPGLLYFLYALIYPLFEKSNRNFLFLVFLTTMLLSMLTEDTLKTQPGATFFAFFNALLLFARPQEN